MEEVHRQGEEEEEGRGRGSGGGEGGRTNFIANEGYKVAVLGGGLGCGHDRSLRGEERGGEAVGEQQTAVYSNDGLLTTTL